MSKDTFPPRRTPTPPFVQPFLHSLNRMQARELLRPEQLAERARALLGDCFGARQGTTEAAFAHGCLMLAGEHTLHFEGFALLLGLPQGASVAVRRTDAAPSRLAMEGRGVVPLGEDAEEPVVCLLAALAGTAGPVEMALVSAVPPVCVEAALAAAGVGHRAADL